MTKIKGQSLIEFLILSPLSVLLFVPLLCFLYLFYSKTMISYFGHRSLLCLEEAGKTHTSCKRELREVLERQLFLSDHIYINLKRTKKQNTLRLSHRLYFKNLSHKKTLRKKS